jgi:predicted glycosyltransferase
MKIVIDINHPAHVHYFKHFITEMQKRGHKIIITATEKDITYKLLKKYDLDFVRMGSHGNTMIKKIFYLPLMVFSMYLAVRKFQPDIFLGFGSIRAAYTAAILRKPCINFEDTEHSTGQISLYKPFVNCICTPSSFIGSLGPKQVRFNGSMDLAYLHPKRFTPDPAILQELGLKETDTFIVVRFVSWEASHDIGQHGIKDKSAFVKFLKNYGCVLLTTEGTLPAELEPYLIKISPEKLHNLLYYAALYVGEGGTMASEAAVLGTHAIHISTTAKYCGVFQDLHNYGLLWTVENDSSAYECITSLMQIKSLKEEGKIKREKLVNDKTDVTSFMIWFIESYPESYNIMKTNPEYSNIFK